MNRSLALIAPLLLYGCMTTTTAEPPPSPALETVFQDAYCGMSTTTPTAWWASDAAAWQALAPKLRPSVPGPGRGPDIDVDFARYDLLLFTIGRQRSGGHTISLAADRGELDAGTLRVPIRWQPPPEDAIVTQALTQPCMVIKIAAGSYERIRVVPGPDSAPFEPVSVMRP